MSRSFNNWPTKHLVWVWNEWNPYLIPEYDETNDPLKNQVLSMTPLEKPFSSKNSERVSYHVRGACLRSVRSVVFVEGGLNTNCTGLSKFVWIVLMFKYETNLWRKYKRNKIWVNIIYIKLKGCCNYSTVYGMEIPLNKN